MDGGTRRRVAQREPDIARAGDDPAVGRCTPVPRQRDRARYKGYCQSVSVRGRGPGDLSGADDLGEALCFMTKGMIARPTMITRLRWHSLRRR